MRPVPGRWRQGTLTPSLRTQNQNQPLPKNRPKQTKQNRNKRLLGLLPAGEPWLYHPIEIRLLSHHKDLSQSRYTLCHGRPLTTVQSLFRLHTCSNTDFTKSDTTQKQQMKRAQPRAAKGRHSAVLTDSSQSATFSIQYNSCWCAYPSSGSVPGAEAEG